MTTVPVTHVRPSRPDRRTVLTAAAVAAGVGIGAAGCGPGTAPRDADTTFVLVHGSASSSYFWTPLVRQLALLGRRSLPVDLPGHGGQAPLPRSYQSPQDTRDFAASTSSVAGMTMDTYIEAVADIVDHVKDHGPIVLVGHSLGGSVVTGVANRNPENLIGTTYVSAFCCTDLASPLDYLATSEAKSGAAGPIASSLSTDDQSQVPEGVSRYNWRSADREFIDSSRAQLMADFSEQEFLAAINMAQQPDESIQASLAQASIDPDTWGQIDHAYIRLTEDRLNTPDLQDRMISEADRAVPANTFRTADIPTSHLGVHRRPRELANILHDLWP